MAYYKRLPLDGLVNARDLGGFPTTDGRITKYGVFVRSEVPKELSENDLQFLKDYGITLSLDLRSASEAKTLPSVFSALDWVTYHPCPMMNEDTAKASKKEHEETDKNPNPVPPPNADKSFWDIDWAPVYIHILETGCEWVRRIITTTAEWEGGIHYHCFTGKDRTGIFTALLLGLCNVDIRDIMWDYSLSQTCLRPFYEKMDTGILFTKEDGSPDFTRGFYRTAPDTMETVLRHLIDKYGSVTDYIRFCGVSEDLILKLRDKMTETV
jgi:protein-tyrosine phosphatase